MIVHVAVLLPSTVLTVIVVVPTATAVTVPLLTVATLVLLLVQVTFLFVAFAGATVASNVNVELSDKSLDVLFKETPVTATVVTVTVHVPTTGWSFSSYPVAVIVVVPAETPVTKPVLETVATLVLLDSQTNVFWFVSEGVKTGSN